MLDDLESRIASVAAELRALQAEARRIRRNERLKCPEQRARRNAYQREYWAKSERTRWRQKMRRAGIEPHIIERELAMNAARDAHTKEQT